MRRYLSIAMILLFVGRTSISQSPSELPFVRSLWFDEQTCTIAIEPKMRIHINAPLDGQGRAGRPTWLVIFALPNGNTIEQTLGCEMKPGLDWHYDIQHVAAQVRMLRSLMPDERIVLLLAEAGGLSWPQWRQTVPDANAKIGALVDDWRRRFGGDDAKVTITGHSGGGSFEFGLIESADRIPDYVDRIAFLDSNYSFDADKHGAKLENWLNGDKSCRLIVVAYDDREITLDGKKVVEPTGGTYRATGRMRDTLAMTFRLTEADVPPFHETVGLDGRIHFYVHSNTQNKILHTALVGDMNGLVHVLTLGTSQEAKQGGSWSKFGGPRAFTKWIQPEPEPTTSNQLRPTKSQSRLAPRPRNAVGGAAFIEKLAGLSLDDREAAILREIISGNFPEFLRAFKTVKLRGTSRDGREVVATLEVMPDYLAVGSDDDFIRMPMTPQTAQQIADRFGCTLPTRKIVDAIDAAAEVHLAPYPLAKQREAATTFLEHHQIIERQRGDRPLGLLVTGIKKDIVLTPRIFERPDRVAIYGWRRLDGQPIQPLTIVHWNRYVDYSHGARLVRGKLKLEEKAVDVTDLLADPARAWLVSDEGPMNPPRYPLAQALDNRTEGRGGSREEKSRIEN